MNKWLVLTYASRELEQVQPSLRVFGMHVDSIEASCFGVACPKVLPGSYLRGPLQHQAHAEHANHVHSSRSADGWCDARHQHTNRRRLYRSFDALITRSSTNRAAPGCRP